MENGYQQFQPGQLQYPKQVQPRYQSTPDNVNYMSPQPNYMDQIQKDQSEFKNGVNQLLNKLKGIQQDPTMYSPQQFSPSKPNPIDNEILKNNQDVQQYNILDQLRKTKEENIQLLQQLNQLNNVIKGTQDVKSTIGILNSHIQELQGKLDYQLKQNYDQKQQLIQTEQEKILMKKQFDESLNGLQLQQQRELQQQEIRWREALQNQELKYTQEKGLHQAQTQNYLKNISNKVGALQNENALYIQKQKDLLLTVKDQQLRIDQLIQENYIINESLQERRTEIDKLQKDYDRSLEKYEINTKQLLQSHQARLNQYEEVIKELKQHNNALSIQIVNQDAKFKQDNLDLRNKLQNEFLEKYNDKQNQHLSEIQAVQQYFQEKLQKLEDEKQNLIQEKEQLQLYLNQKISVLLQENDVLALEVSNQRQKVNQLLQAIEGLEAQLKKLQNDNSFQIKALNKQVVDLQDQLKRVPRKQDVAQQSEQLIKVQQQLDYKREEMELLLHHIDQIINLNQQQEQTIAQLTERLQNSGTSNENENYTELLKSYKQQINDYLSKIQQLEKKDQQNSLLILQLQKQQNGNQQTKESFNDQNVQELKRVIIDKEEEIKNLQQMLIDEQVKRPSSLSQSVSQIQQSPQKEKEIQSLKQLNDHQKELILTIQKENEMYKDQLTYQEETIQRLEEQLKNSKSDKLKLSMQLMHAGMANLGNQ
ncbi:hypothetical protein pb186bvf_000692 [Paramecium bursaria]